MEIDWQLVLSEVGTASLWAARNGKLFLVSLAGAAIGNFLYTFPETARIRKKLQTLFPSQRGVALARLHFAVVILAGTFVATVVIQPASEKEAFLAGFTWLSVLSALAPRSEAAKVKGGSNG